ncbi:MAG: cell wall hydrolase [Roseiarcus sp.]|jgi:hypothetical protein
MGLIVSITAQAGQDPVFDLGAGPMRDASLSATMPLPGDLFRRTSAENIGLQARLTIGSPDDLSTVDDEIDPRADLKQARVDLPAIDRSRKGDPFIGLRPGFDARLNRQFAPGVRRASGDPDFNAGLAGAPSPPAAPSSGAVEAESTAPPAELGRRFDDGATPSLPLEVALNSATPTPNDGVRTVVAAAAPETTLARMTAPGEKPDYASLIDANDAARQQRCLADAIYFEARSEPEDGQAAVAQVVLNRVRSGNYPADVCGVVYQDRNHPFACQFSFACEGKSLRIEEPAAWAVAVRIAKDVTSGALYNPLVGEAVNYHANYVLPYWASALQRVDRIGHHIFYKLRVGQN